MSADQDPADPPKEPEIAIVLDSGASSARLLASMAPRPGPPRFIDPVSAPPVLTGPHGRVWLIDMVSARLKYGLDPKKDGTVAAWVIEAPWAHPVWHSYTLALVHLRPIEDAPKTITHLDGATHEF